MTKDLKEKIDKIVEWALDKKAENVKILDVDGKTSFTDAIVVCNGSVELHNKAIADHIIQNVKAEKMDVLSKEGYDSGNWILLDLAEVVIHIFTKEKRNYYKIEDLYNISPKRQLNEENK